MNLWLRLIGVVFVALFRPRLGWLDESRLRFRVLPHDLDINIHMNNARYMALMDLGRLDLILRSGLWRPLVRWRWQPVLGAALVRFRRPLRPFQALALKSRVLGWDEKWLYIEHRIEAGGTLACQATVRAAFVAAGGVMPPARLAALLGHSTPSPELPPWVASWLAMDRLLDQQPPRMAAGE